MISYEVGFGLTVMGVLSVSGSFSPIEMIFNQKVVGSYSGPLLPLFFLFYLTSVAETSRAPFDLAEGESELVSGFNVEYSGMTFALFFLAEYASILFFSLLMEVIFFSGLLLVWPFYRVTFVMVGLSFIWLRSSFPRVRYDNLMKLF